MSCLLLLLLLFIWTCYYLSLLLLLKSFIYSFYASTTSTTTFILELIFAFNRYFFSWFLVFWWWWWLACFVSNVMFFFSFWINFLRRKQGKNIFILNVGNTYYFGIIIIHMKYIITKPMMMWMLASLPLFFRFFLSLIIMKMLDKNFIFALEKKGFVSSHTLSLSIVAMIT